MRPKHLKALPRPVDDPEMWKKLLNHLYGCEQDELFKWAKSIREELESEARRRRGAA